MQRESVGPDVVDRTFGNDWRAAYRCGLGLPDPKGQALERAIEIRDLIYTKAEILARELRGTPSA